MAPRDRSIRPPSYDRLPEAEQKIGVRGDRLARSPRRAKHPLPCGEERFFVESGSALRDRGAAHVAVDADQHFDEDETVAARAGWITRSKRGRRIRHIGGRAADVFGPRPDSRLIVELRRTDDRGS